MKEPENNADIIKRLTESKNLRLVQSEKRESLLPDPQLKALIERMKGKPKRARLTLDDGPEAA